MTDNTEQPQARDWFHDRAQFLYWCTLILAMIIIAVSCMRNPVDYDSWWHLKMGQDLIEQGLSPFKDHYSFTFLGTGISQPPVIFQVGYYTLIQWFGEWGGQVAFKLLSYSALFLAFVALLAQLRAPTWVRILVIALLITVIQSRMQIRPELISYTLMTLSFLLYARAREDFSWKTMVPIVLLLVFWVNYHNPLFGYIIFFGLFLDVAVRQLQEGADLKAWGRWLGWGLLLLALGYMRPDGQHFLLGWLNFSPEWKSQIREYFPPVGFITHYPTYLWLTAAALALVLAIIQRQFGYLVILLVFIYTAFNMSRIVTPAAIVVLCVLASVLTRQSETQATDDQSDGKPNALRAFGGILSVAGIALGFLGALEFLAENRSRTPNVPVAAVNYLEETGATGNIYNVYAVGGYLIYRLSPDLKVYIDGRTGILYTIEHFLRYRDTRSSSTALREEVEKYDIEYAIVANDEISTRLMYESDFELEFSDSLFSLYRRSPGRFPTLGTLATLPYCTQEIDNAELEAEALDSYETHPEVAYINGLMAMAYNYRQAQDKSAYLNSINPGAIGSRPNKRLYAALAMKHDLTAQSAQALQLLDVMLPRDQMAMALMLHRNGATDIARERLGLALDNFSNWQFVYQRDLELLIILLRELDPQGSLELLIPEARAELEQAVAPPESITTDSLTAMDFCAANPLGGGKPASGETNLP